MIKECNYCGATGEYIENGGICECGVGAEWVNVVGGHLEDDGYYWGGGLKLSSIDNVLEDKRSGKYN